MKHQKLLWLLFFVAISTTSSRAGIDPPPTAGARAISMGNAHTAIKQNFWNLFYNPAGIAGIQQPFLGVYAERRFGLSELNYGHAGIVFPFAEEQAIGATIGSFGFEAYRENQASLSYAIRLMERISLGTRFHYGNLTIKDHGNTSILWASIGLQTQVNAEITLGFHVWNINRSSLNYQNGLEDIPTVFTTGIAYQPNDHLILVADIQKDIDHPVSFKAGLEYVIVSGLFARIGFGTEPLSLSGGLGLQHKNLQIDAAFSFHELLGYTPHVSLQYQI
ncbi:MAG: hypothetical protein KDE26_25400 [Bacteroidetes bacterium]|nr:hypothetical protein [Bacteroidota bacterium]